MWRRSIKPNVRYRRWGTRRSFARHGAPRSGRCHGLPSSRCGLFHWFRRGGVGRTRCANGCWCGESGRGWVGWPVWPPLSRPTLGSSSQTFVVMNVTSRLSTGAQSVHVETLRVVRPVVPRLAGPVVVAVRGPSRSGKTSLVERLIKEGKERGWKVAWVGIGAFGVREARQAASTRGLRSLRGRSVGWAGDFN